MTQDQIIILTHLIDQCNQVRPEMEPDDFMNRHWLPFLQTLDLPDRRMAWQVYLRAQVNDFHTIAHYLQGLSAIELEKIRPTLDQLITGALDPAKKRLAA